MEQEKKEEYPSDEQKEEYPSDEYLEYYLEVVRPKRQAEVEEANCYFMELKECLQMQRFKEEVEDYFMELKE
jgi:hypothetical protein